LLAPSSCTSSHAKFLEPTVQKQPLGFVASDSTAVTTGASSETPAKASSKIQKRKKTKQQTNKEFKFGDAANSSDIESQSFEESLSKRQPKRII